MRLTLVDDRALAVAICLPDSNLYLNWSSGKWETPFSPANHLMTMSRVAPAPDPNYRMQTADIGTAIESVPGAVAAIYAAATATSGTLTYVLADVAASPFPSVLGTLAVVTRQ